MSVCKNTNKLNVYVSLHVQFSFLLPSQHSACGLNTDWISSSAVMFMNVNSRVTGVRGADDDDDDEGREQP